MGVATVTATPLSKRAVDFYDPREKGGSLLNKSAGLGEPLNVIISGLSSPEVLTQKGFLNFMRAAGLYVSSMNQFLSSQFTSDHRSKECFGLHNGGKQQANLGDGHGDVDEREVLREHYSIPIFGTCLESLIGGNHLRLLSSRTVSSTHPLTSTVYRTFRQDGPDANSGALFLA